MEASGYQEAVSLGFPGGQVQGLGRTGLCMGHAGDSGPLPVTTVLPLLPQWALTLLALKVSTTPVPAGAPRSELVLSQGAVRRSQEKGLELAGPVLPPDPA